MRAMFLEFMHSWILYYSTEYSYYYSCVGLDLVAIAALSDSKRHSTNLGSCAPARHRMRTCECMEQHAESYTLVECS